jgi:hypothetical protein
MKSGRSIMHAAVKNNGGRWVLSILFAGGLLLGCQTVQTPMTPLTTTPSIANTATLFGTPGAQVAAPKSNAATATVAIAPPIPTHAVELTTDLCRNHDVRVAFGDWDKKYSRLRMSINLTNTTATACVVHIYPDVHLLDAAGKALEIDYPTLNQGPNTTYFLVRPGQSVGFVITLENWCKKPKAGGIRLQLALNAEAPPVAIDTTGSMLEQAAIYSAAVCTQPSKKAEAITGAFGYSMPVPLEP